LSRVTITSIFDDLYSLKDINTVLLVRTDGVVLLSNIPNKSPDSELIKSLEWIVSVVPSVSREMRKKNLKKVIYDLESAIIIFYSCSSQIVLIALTDPTANLGLLTIELSRTAKIIGEVINY